MSNDAEGIFHRVTLWGEHVESTQSIVEHPGDSCCSLFRYLCHDCNRGFEMHYHAVIRATNDHVLPCGCQMRPGILEML